MSEFEKEIVFYPAYDKRDPDPSKNYGISGVTLRFHLKKDNKAVQFVLYTGWHLPHVSAEINRQDSPIPADLGYHSPYPMYEGQSPTEGGCHLINGDCYYDGSGLAADRVYKILLNEGSEGVWKELESYWHETFDGSNDD